MIVTPKPAELSLPESLEPRSSGVHVSSIIREIAITQGILKYGTVDADSKLLDKQEITDPTAILRIAIGLSWEEWYIPRILGPQGVVDHPGEMSQDGIYMTHDGESLDVIITPKGSKGRGRIHEIKATYKSTNTVGEDLRTQWMWLCQVMAYCKGSGTRFATIHVLFLCGDYRMPITPQLKIWDIEFSQKEIDDNWTLIKDYRDYREGV